MQHVLSIGPAPYPHLAESLADAGIELVVGRDVADEQLDAVLTDYGTVGAENLAELADRGVPLLVACASPVDAGAAHDAEPSARCVLVRETAKRDFIAMLRAALSPPGRPALT